MSIGWRIGVDLGGSKIAAAAMDEKGATRLMRRIATPSQDYHATLDSIAALVTGIEGGCGLDGTSVGIGIPGSLSPTTGRVQNANSVYLNGRALDHDLACRLGRPVRIANDANCFALSEAIDGAGAGHRCVLGVILGTGCGSGLVFNGNIVDGPRGAGGEWGHNSLPWAQPDEHPGPRCWCGRHGCMEAWVSGPALATITRA